MQIVGFAKVIVNNKSSKTDIEYTYGISRIIQDKLNLGSRVIVPFGQGNKLVEGFVIEITDDVNLDLSKIKCIKEVVDENTILSAELIDLCRWMKKFYMCRFIDAIQCVIPTGASLKPQKKIIATQRLNQDIILKNGFSNDQKKIIELLNLYKSTTEDFLKKSIGKQNISTSIKNLEQKGLITVKSIFKRDVNPTYQKIVKLSQQCNIHDAIIQLNKRATKQKEVLVYLLEYGEVEWTQLHKTLNVSISTIRTLENKGLIEIVNVKKKRIPYKEMRISSIPIPQLTTEQVYAIEQVLPFIQNDKYKSFLLHGVTGSGKTEVYMRLIDEVIKNSKTAIVLVPEISLTTQMIEHFKGRFGERVAVLHSRLSLGERYDEWKRIKNGEVQIAIGARSAVFAPFNNLGIIIVDEEHEHTYKSEYSPKYHAVEVAEFRCMKNKAVLVLGSATPSIDTYTKALNGKYQKIEMHTRFNNNPLPNIEIVDMRNELNKGNKSIFSEQLYKGIKENLHKGEQTILFLNRRGYSTFISCRKCGYVVKCPYCEISLTYHANSHDVICHYCGFKKEPPRICPKCSSKYIKYFGIGTEKIERLTKKHFPEARIARLDLDTASKKGVMDQIIYNFKKGNLDILIGTQMIAKGLDFPNVTLVGVITADSNLNLPDFRSAEKTFQLITQVAGRAGRGDNLGKVVVQTYEPDHFAITSAQNYDYNTFYKQEIILRKEFFYPPYSILFRILFSGTNEAQVIKSANQFSNLLQKEVLNCNIVFDETVFGPHPAPMSKIKQKYRWQIIIKSRHIDQKFFKRIIDNIRFKDYFKNISLNVDINPYSML